MGAIRTDRVFAAFAASERLTPSEWADRYRYLPSSVAAEPGRYRSGRTPYIVGITDAVLEPGVEEIVVLKAVQIGYTKGLQNLIGWAIDQQPAPMLIVMPSQAACDDLVEEELRPLVEHSPKLRQHVGHDNDLTKGSLVFDTMPVFLGWAGSPQSLARRACRYVLLDEVDKYPPFSGRDADPIALARARTTTFGHRRRVIIGSTPTTRDGQVFKAYEGCGDRRTYWVPCPHCGEYQQLVFGQVRFNDTDDKAEKTVRADAIELGKLATYECVSCRGAVLDEHKPRMLERGVWLSETQSIDKSGTISGERPKSPRVGFRISALYSPWVSFSRLAAQFLRANGDTGAMMEFKNQLLAEPFEQFTAQVKVEDLRAARDAAPAAGKLPPWAGRLVVGTDTQKHGFYWILRAYGQGERSQLVTHGMVTSFEAMTAILNTSYEFADGTGTMTPDLMFIDSGGHRKDEVYQYAQTDPRIYAIKGASSYRPRLLVERSNPDKTSPLNLWILDTQHFKDRIATLRRDGLWSVNCEASDEYLRHLAAEAKGYDKKAKMEVWQPVSSGIPNHYLDCEVYAQAAAHLIQVRHLPSETELVAQRRAAIKARQQEPTQPAQRQATGILPEPTSRTSSWLRPASRY